MKKINKLKELSIISSTAIVMLALTVRHSVVHCKHWHHVTRLPSSLVESLSLHLKLNTPVWRNTIIFRLWMPQCHHHRESRQERLSRSVYHPRQRPRPRPRPQPTAVTMIIPGKEFHFHFQIISYILNRKATRN